MVTGLNQDQAKTIRSAMEDLLKGGPLRKGIEARGFAVDEVECRKLLAEVDEVLA